MARAIEAISEKQSTWRPTELHRELGGLFPTDVGADAAAVISALDRVVDAIATKQCVDISQPIPPDSLLRRDGRPVTEAATDRALTTQAILDQEVALLEWAALRISADDLLDPAAIDRSDVDLNIAQAEAAARVAGNAQLVLIVGPAGTGNQAGTGQPSDSAALRLPRAGLVVSKAVGGSVVRSTVSRRLRHLLKERLGALPPGARLVVRAAPLSGSASSAALAADLDTAMASALRPRTGRPQPRTAGSAP